MTLARDEHEASRGEASESHVRLASWTQSWNRLAESIPWNRLASPRHESKHLGLASNRSRRGELALELALREPTRRLISPTVCYVKNRILVAHGVVCHVTDISVNSARRVGARRDGNFVTLNRILVARGVTFHVTDISVSPASLAESRRDKARQVGGHRASPRRVWGQNRLATNESTPQLASPRLVSIAKKADSSRLASPRLVDSPSRLASCSSLLVARGFSQIYGVNYRDTYAPVVKLESIRILIAIAAIYGLEIHQMDVVTAFLAGELKEEIYMEQPEGFEIGTKEEDLVCQLRKSLYGLKQAPRVWNRKIRHFLKSIGFDQTYSDPCVYINKTTDIIIAMWVDDFIIFGKNMASINSLKAQLNKEYEMKDLGELKHFLGIQVHRDRERKIIHISQPRYARTVLNRYGMQDNKPASSPLPTGARLIKVATTDVLTDQKEYQSIVGSLMYAMLATRPDLAQCIQQISQFSQTPTRTHEKAAKHALRYFNGTVDEGITYNGNLGMRLNFWSDANWGGEEGRESVPGFVATMAGGAVTYSSKKQGSVALSTTESEYMALLHTLKEQIWLLRFLSELSYDISNQNIIYCDNQSAIALAHNPEHHARTKHIDIQYHFVRNCVEDGTTQLEYCPTEDMVADGLTKTLGPERHKKLARMMGMGVWKAKGNGSSVAEV